MQKAINAVCMLGLDAIEQANSGHPGIVMGAAPTMTTLWTKYLRVHPDRPTWINRDRFVLSAGHGSMLLYALLHLSGFDVTLDDLKNFRQLDSKTPGHPEYKHTPGVDATTGPLGQGLAMGVGMALAERKLAATYNRPEYHVFDHFTYVLCGDGDLMEGVSSEASSFASLQKLAKLIVLYDSNDINLDGATSESFTEDVRKRYDSYGWQTLYVEDGTNIEALETAIKLAQADTMRPTLIEIKTVIGCGSSKEGTNAVHGAPLGSDDVAQIKQKCNWLLPSFEIEADVYTYYQQHVKARGIDCYTKWATNFNAYALAYPELAEQLQQAIQKQWQPIQWSLYDVGFEQATRNSSKDCIQKIAQAIPSFFGGSADLAHSNMTFIEGESLFLPTAPEHRNIQYGVREFAMAAIANGLSLHGGLLPYVSTFLVFSDYLKPAVRLSALMGQQVFYVFTHDSIAVGEDGPTHEPIEQLAMLRSIPNMYTFRPADANETIGAWHAMVHLKAAPSALILTRQNLPVSAATQAGAVSQGAYVALKEQYPLSCILIASGSEVTLALAVAKTLSDTKQIGVRVVSMPCMELFDLQSQEYKQEVLPQQAGVKRVAIEMGHPQPWYKYVGLNDLVIGITSFGASGKATDVMAKFGFTTEKITAKVEALLAPTQENN